MLSIKVTPVVWRFRTWALPAEGPAGMQRVNDDSALSFKGLTRDRVNTVGAAGGAGGAAQAT